jgi:hypothetical protein
MVISRLVHIDSISRQQRFFIKKKCNIATNKNEYCIPLYQNFCINTIIMDKRRRSPRRGHAVVCPTPLPLAPVARSSPSSIQNRKQTTSPSGIKKKGTCSPQQQQQQEASDSPNVIDNRRNSIIHNNETRDRSKSKKQKKPLLIILSDNCRKHSINGNTHHESNHVLSEEWDNVPLFCQEALTTLKRILPRVENRILIIENNNNNNNNSNDTKMISSNVSDLGHLCDFYNDVILGGFCPHALHLFDLGKGAIEGKYPPKKIYVQKCFL